MARLPYSLQIHKTIPLESANGTTYTAKIWTTYSGGTDEWILASNGLKIDWESANIQDKNSPILASKLTLDVLVEDLVQELDIGGMTSRAEKDVWITLRRGASGSLLWSGYLLPNLDIREDVSYPYISTLVFVDGIGNLKEKAFVREINPNTGVAPTFPYNKTDTYIYDGYQRIIGSTTFCWIKEILDKIGMVLESDEATPGAGLENYVIQTAVNWWNEDMGVGPQSATCPLTQTQISFADHYQANSNNEFTAVTVYDALLSICKSFNMRMFYWQHTFHFIQISEFNTNEQGSAPYTTPINIPTREFFYTGGYRTSRNYFGTTDYSLYNQEIETGTTNSGLQKLATTQYESLPAIKRTKTTYAELAGGNYFNGFPLFLTHNTVIGLDNTWPADDAAHFISQFSQSGQEYNIMTISDADQLSGFNFRLYCSFTNTSNAQLNMTNMWTLRAKPSGSAWGDVDNMTLYRDIGTTNLLWKANEFPLTNNKEYIRDTMGIPANSTDYVKTLFNSTYNYLTVGSDGLIPVSSNFIGSWDFQFATYTEYDRDKAQPMYAYHSGSWNSAYSHGLVLDSTALAGGTNYVGTALEWGQVPTFYNLDYVDTITTEPNGGAYFRSLFVPVKTGGVSFGNTGQEIEVEQSGNNSYEYNVGVISFGDGSGADTNSTYKVWNGSAWVYASPFGKWAKGIYNWSGSAYVWSSLTYDKKSQVLVGEEIINNQSNTILTFSGTTALSSVNKYFSGSTKLKFMNPCARMEDSDGKKYMMLRSSFNLIDDEWNGQWAQVFYNDPGNLSNGIEVWQTENNQTNITFYPTTQQL